MSAVAVTVAPEAPPVALEELVSVVLPCLNEADSVGACVREALETLAAAGIAAEVVVVDNGSSDGSPNVAATAGARVIHEGARGYGSALRAGINAARGTIVVMADADWTYDFSKLPRLIEPLLAGDADLVVGSRLDSATRQTMPMLHRYVGTPTLSFLVRRAGRRVDINDSQSGYRAFRKQTATRLALNTSGMEFASEMLIRAGQLGLRVIEVETGYRERVGDSKLNTFRDGARHAWLIFMLAPELVLVTPGLVLFALGTLLTVMGFLSPGGVDIGSLRWQPIFFSTIAVVLGMELSLVGMVLASRSSLVGEGTHRRYHFATHKRFPGACMTLGGVALLLGLALDFVLFLGLSTGRGPVTFSLALASTAQSLIIAGGSLATMGFVLRALAFNQRNL